MVISIQTRWSLCALVLAVALSALVGAGSARAADQYWVSLGSFNELRGAEQMRDQASSTFYQLSIVPSESPIGFVYRVVEGPVADRPSGESLLRQARNAGFIDAWLVIQDSTLPMGEITAYDRSDLSDPYELPVAESDYSNAYASDPAESASSADYNTVKIGKEELVETAPAGYGLHRLDRSLNSLPPGAAPESRLRELRSDAESAVQAEPR